MNDLEADARRWQQYWNRLSDLDRCLTLDIERAEET